MKSNPKDKPASKEREPGVFERMGAAIESALIANECIDEVIKSTLIEEGVNPKLLSLLIRAQDGVKSMLDGVIAVAIWWPTEGLRLRVSISHQDADSKE